MITADGASAISSTRTLAARPGVADQSITSLLAQAVEHRPVQPPPQAGLGPGYEVAVRGRLGTPSSAGRCRQAQPVESM
jgi:hypothetical protein